ncbi:hypothetical protein I7I50_08345 [Histoplasma capsulatum G186AR]|uniref:Uncharacterized protein n=1 Tax=Ajellomyces capsulatus TaxID=5037 RepID=A0A8H7YTR7_AJECA|nr:hypothetical protein I7I52_05861 [Histoplasma capsulatum]QSS73541.1 hypothetical protein I7I50_08345 [Histoplasma capsulatum G186AR]
MSYNKIISKKVVDSFTRNGVNITISVATKTSIWERPNLAVDTVAKPFSASLKSFTGTLPEGTADVCARL